MSPLIIAGAIVIVIILITLVILLLRVFDLEKRVEALEGKKSRLITLNIK
jgi:uncharacterized membrane protein YqiK